MDMKMFLAKVLMQGAAALMNGDIDEATQKMGEQHFDQMQEMRVGKRETLAPSEEKPTVRTEFGKVGDALIKNYQEGKSLKSNISETFGLDEITAENHSWKPSTRRRRETKNRQRADKEIGITPEKEMERFGKSVATDVKNKESTQLDLYKKLLHSSDTAEKTKINENVFQTVFDADPVARGIRERMKFLSETKGIHPSPAPTQQITPQTPKPKLH